MESRKVRLELFEKVQIRALYQQRIIFYFVHRNQQTQVQDVTGLSSKRQVIRWYISSRIFTNLSMIHKLWVIIMSGHEVFVELWDRMAQALSKCEVRNFGCEKVSCVAIENWLIFYSRWIMIWIHHLHVRHGEHRNRGQNVRTNIPAHQTRPTIKGLG